MLKVNEDSSSVMNSTVAKPRGKPVHRGEPFGFVLMPVKAVSIAALIVFGNRLHDCPAVTALLEGHRAM